MAESCTSFPSPDATAIDALPRQRARLLLPVPLDGIYDYRIPQGITVEPGSIVVAPFAGRRLIGVVWDDAPIDSDEDKVPESKLKPIEMVFDVPPMPAYLRRLVEWVSNYTLAPLGAVLRMALGPVDSLSPQPGKTAFVAAGTVPDGTKLTQARRQVLEALAPGMPMSAAELAEAAGCGTSVIRAMAKAGLLVETKVAARAPRPRPDGTRPLPRLSDDQAAAAEIAVAAVEARRFETLLLDGVTGSGKTEVYFNAVAAALKSHRQVLVLLPEIALGAQWQSRFEKQFGCRPAIWHSEVGPNNRRDLWRDVALGQAQVVVGARSALFLPFPDLGLIIVDEEHDNSFKQEDGVIYHARDMAIVRASIEAIPIILASATPSLESLVNAERGRYRRLVLPDRHGGAALPDIELVDLRVDKPARQRFLSPKLLTGLRQVLDAGEQAMLFLNRRGYAPLTLCRTCGHRLECPNCTAWLVEHRLIRKLTCHHCGYAAPLPETCPICHEEHSFAACGPGVERLAEEVAECFPEARFAVMASDMLMGPHAAAELVAKVQDHEIDLLIGTQMMAKGHHFPMLTLVGVVDADLGLAGGDLRAAERTFQLLHQVAGRAGREERPGRVLLQTFDPEQPVLQALAAQDRDGFLAVESEARRDRGLPPHGRLAALIVSGPDAESADAAAAGLARAAPHTRGIDILGPAPAPLAVLRGRHRRRFLVKAGREVNLQALLRQWLGRIRLPASIRLQIDVDPYSFL